MYPARQLLYDMASILVAGVRESDKDTVIQLIRKMKSLPAFGFVDFDDVIMGDRKLFGELASLGAFESLTTLKSWGIKPEEKSYDALLKAVARFYNRLETQVKEASKTSGNVIVSGYCTLKTHYGQLPLLSKNFLEYFRPDVLVVIESDLGSRAHVLDEDYGILMQQNEGRRGELRQLGMDQAIARSSASAFVALYGGLLKVVQVRQGRVKQALKDTVETIQFVFRP